MYTKELTLNSKLAEICKGRLTVFNSEPIPEVRVGEAKSFKMVGEEKLSEQELVTHKKERYKNLQEAIDEYKIINKACRIRSK